MPDSDDRQQELWREGSELLAADRAAAVFDHQRRARPAVALQQPPQEDPKPPVKKTRPTKIDYGEFGRLLARWPRLSERPFDDIKLKREILMGSGYTHLKGPRGRPVLLRTADDFLVGRAFANTLTAYRRRLASAKAVEQQLDE